MRALLLAVALMMASSTPAEARGSRKYSSSSKKTARVCKKGKACGNSCIAKSAICHQEKGTATNADEKNDSATQDERKAK